ncbi:hypothetical protein K488DRAFT_89340 [Vararia minispora EC-137]|uniref:Uncharacterized protein n=1 Tax=Vararia minispora EC-137 TaxID=1314806 RepID=A0ACB8QAH9_9AGAM|nr:hypothetical protein K488DRAFT_89340 [Vararia minispora EC-137]
MTKLAVIESTLVRASLIGMGAVQLLPLLPSMRWRWPALKHVIGLFGLVGMLGTLLASVSGRLINDLILWYTALFATLSLVGV